VLRGSFALLIVLGLAAVAVRSQTTSTEILGLVTDSTGAVVPGAKVTITRLATGETRSTATNRAGEYIFRLIEIGDYTVRCEMQGFKIETVTGLRVQIQQKARVDITLQLGQISESVEVTAAAVALKTEDATVGQVIENRRIIELPLNGRNLNQLAALVPGVQFGNRAGLNDGQGGFPIPGATIGVSANGQRELNGIVSLDGVDAKSYRNNVTAFTPSIEAIEEFKVQTGSYSAEYGQGSGAIIEISMKSGTNQLHGTVFEFLRNDKLDAETYFLNFGRPASAGRLPKDRLRRNQFGGVVSGPVVLPGYNGRNRTFWAFDYEARREMRETVSTAFFPPLSFRNGDFSALLTPATNPATGRLFRSPIVIFDPLTGDPFPDNVIPRSRLSPGGQNMLKFIPPPQFQQADILDFTASNTIPSPTTQNQFYVRGDHIFRDSDKVFARIALDRSTYDSNSVNPNFPFSQKSQPTNLASQWIHTFSQTMLNELRFGLNIANDDQVNPRTNTDFDLDTLAIGKFRVVGDNNRKLRPREAGIPSIGFTIGDRSTNDDFDRTSTYQFSDNFSIIRNKHNFKMGGQYSYSILDRAAANFVRGGLSFGGNESGYNFASLMLGYPSSSNTAEGLVTSRDRFKRASAYFLDDWKATSRLTLNLGIRWDFYGNPLDVDGVLRTVDFVNTYAAPNGTRIPTIFPGQLGAAGKVPLWEQEYRYFMPRVGIAYRPTSKWVIRTGGGWFTTPRHFNTYSLLSNMPPLSGSQQLNSVTDAGRSVPVSWAGQNFTLTTRRFRPGSPILTLDDPFGGTAGAAPVALLSVQPDHKTTSVVQWSFDIQRQLPLDTALTVAYVGNKSTHTVNSISNFNSGDPSPDTNFQIRRPYQKFYDPAVPQRGIQDLGSIRYFDSYGNGNYHGLQVTFEKRYSRGLSYGLAYAFSKSLGDGQDGGNEEAEYQDPRNRALSRGPYRFDQKHNLVAHFVYELPFARNMGGVPGAFLKGWQINGIVSLRSGFPYTVGAGSSPTTTTGGDLNTGGGNARPDRIADGRLFDDATRQLWFDPNAFRRVSCNIPGRLDLCHYGSAGRGILDTPGQRSLDFSMFKNFPIRERVRIQFRAELFNATNTPYFGNPNGLSYVGINSVVPDGSRIGEVTGLRQPMRVIQFGLKVSF
jgi:outer membrane receptor protein involved in Fe transport